MLKKYSKNHIAEILRYVVFKKRNYHPKYFKREYLIKEFERSFVSAYDDYNKVKDTNPDYLVEEILRGDFRYLLASINKILTDYTLHERIMKNNMEIFLNGIYTRQRLLFLANILKYPKLDTDRAYMMINFRGSFAYFDHEIVDKFLVYFPEPFKTGYSFYVAYANGLNLIFNGKLEETSSYLNKKSKLKKLTKYERSTLLTLKAIADENEKAFAFELDNTLDLYHRQIFYLNLADFIGIEPHGLYNIAKKVWGRFPGEPDKEFWDHDFVVYSKNKKPKLLLDFSQISPLLESWLKKLPSDIKITELMEDFKKEQNI